MPIYRKYYNLPVHLKENVQIKLQKLEKRDVMVPAKYTNWATHLIVVRKKIMKLDYILIYVVH